MEKLVIRHPSFVIPRRSIPRPSTLCYNLPDRPPPNCTMHRSPLVETATRSSAAGAPHVPARRPSSSASPNCGTEATRPDVRDLVLAASPPLAPAELAAVLCADRANATVAASRSAPSLPSDSPP